MCELVTLLKILALPPSPQHLLSFFPLPQSYLSVNLLICH